MYNLYDIYYLSRENGINSNKTDITAIIQSDSNEKWKNPLRQCYYVINNDVIIYDVIMHLLIIRQYF